MESKSIRKSSLFALITALVLTACGKSPQEIALERETPQAVAERKAALKVEPNISDDEIKECDLNDGLKNAIMNDDATYFDKNVKNLQCYIQGEKPLLNAAISFGREKIVDALLEKKVKDSPYFPAAIDAAETHQLEMLKRLQANGYSLTAKDIGLVTPLEEALNTKSKSNQEHFENLNSEMGIKNVPSPSSPILVVKYLVEQGADPQARNRHGVTPLMLARDLEVTQYLLDQGAYVDAVDDKGFTVVMNKVRRDSDENIKVLKRILEHKPNVNHVTTDDKRTALHWAAEYSNINLVQLLLVNGADANLKDVEDKTPLMIAKEGRNRAVVSLLSRKTKVNTETKTESESKTPQTTTKKQAKVKTKKSRINKNQPINRETYNSLKKDLKAASRNIKCSNHRELEKAIKKDDVNFVKSNVTNFSCSISKDGITPLLLAIVYKAPKSIEYLLPLTKDNTYLPAAVFAAMNLDLALLKKLKPFNFPLDAYMIDGNNAAHSAVKADYKRLSRKSKNTSPTTAVLKYLKENGTNFNGANYRGKTPLMLANDPQVLVYLLENGANVNAVDNSGKTALHNMANRGSVKGVEVLMWYKANPNIKDNRGQSVSELVTENEKRYTGSSKEDANIMLKLLNGSKKPRKPRYDPNRPTCAMSKKIGEAIKYDNVEYLKTKVSDYNCLLDGKIDLLNIANILHAEKSFAFLASKVQDNEKIPLMVEVAKKLNIKFLKILLDNNFDINQSNSEQYTALLKAASKSRSISLGLTGKQKSNTPLEVVKFLIENSADINARNKYGRGALELVNSLEVYDYLIAQGMRVDTKNNKGLTALHYYDKSHRSENAQKLIKASLKFGVDIDLKSNEGNTILHQSMQRRDVDDFKEYIKLGANWLIKNNDGYTPLDLAEQSITEDRIISSSDKKELVELIANLKTRKPAVKQRILSQTATKEVANKKQLKIGSLSDFEKNLNNFEVSDKKMSDFYHKDWMAIHSKYKKEESKPIKDQLLQNYEMWKKNKREYKKKNGTLIENQLSVEEIDFNNKIATLDTDLGLMLNATTDAVNSIGRNSSYTKEEREGKKAKIRKQFYEEWLHKKSALQEKEKQSKKKETTKKQDIKKQNTVERIQVTGSKPVKKQIKEQKVEKIEVAAYKPRKPLILFSKLDAIKRIKENRKIANNNLCYEPKKIRQELWKDNVNYFKNNISDLNCYVLENYNLIGFATLHRAHKTLKYLAEKKVQDNPQNSIAIIAAKNFDLKALKIIANNKYSLTSYGERGRTPLLAVLDMDFEKSKKRNAKHNLATPSEIISFMAEKGVDVNQFGGAYHVKTPLMIAKTESAVAALIEYEADPSLINIHSFNALLYATNLKGSNKDKINIIKRIIKADVDINAQGDNGDTALHIAIRHASVEVVALLLQNGADKTIKNNGGRDAVAFTNINIEKNKKNKERLGRLKRIKEWLISDLL